LPPFVDMTDDVLRDLFAAFALAGLLAQRPRRLYTRAALRRANLAAYEAADDMLVVRGRRGR
jgi:hypothetical protein